MADQLLGVKGLKFNMMYIFLDYLKSTAKEVQITCIYISFSMWKSKQIRLQFCKALAQS